MGWSKSIIGFIYHIPHTLANLPSGNLRWLWTITSIAYINGHLSIAILNHDRVCVCVPLFIFTCWSLFLFFCIASGHASSFAGHARVSGARATLKPQARTSSRLLYSSTFKVNNFLPCDDLGSLNVPTVPKWELTPLSVPAPNLLVLPGLTAWIVLPCHALPHTSAGVRSRLSPAFATPQGI